MGVRQSKGQLFYKKLNARNAYRHGTPLHHAAYKGLEETVRFLLSIGANPFAINDDDHKPLDLAREKGHFNVVRAIEGHICHFSGWLIAVDIQPIPAYRRIWVVVLPCNSADSLRPQKFELAIYLNLQVAKPDKVIKLSECDIYEQKLSDDYTSIVVFENKSRAKHKLSGNRQQLQAFYTACRGMPEVTSTVPFPNPPLTDIVPVLPTPALPTAPPAQQSQEDIELAMAINASIQSAIIEGVPGVRPIVSISNTGTGRTDQASPSSSNNGLIQLDPLSRTQTQTQFPPSAPPTNHPSFYNGLIQYPSIDSSPINIATIGGKISNNEESNNKNGENDVCVICLDARLEGACIPCGHMAGCMACLKKIEEKRGECPICWAKINQVLKLYHV